MPAQDGTLYVNGHRRADRLIEELGLPGLHKVQSDFLLSSAEPSPPSRSDPQTSVTRPLVSTSLLRHCFDMCGRRRFFDTAALTVCWYSPCAAHCAQSQSSRNLFG